MDAAQGSLASPPDRLRRGGLPSSQVQLGSQFPTVPPFLAAPPPEHITDQTAAVPEFFEVVLNVRKRGRGLLSSL